MLPYLVQIQADLHANLTGYLKTFSESGDWSALASVLPMGIVFGAVHALTPGHSKMVLSAYLAGSRIGWLKSLGVTTALAFTHVMMAVVIVSASLPLVKFAFGRGAGEAPLLENVSRGLLVAVGLWMLWRAARGPHRHEHGGALVGMLAGLVPCPLTLFAMTFAVVRGVPEAGLVFALAMMVGVALTLSAIALATVFLRERATAILGGVGWVTAGRAIEALAGATLVLVAMSELIGP
ncbi:sulfite exporter TauE/SafE family protein [Aurantimonas sp. VKM B-3413]|uniref:urease accessory protein UreH domain-containing protein n=1 Tax=Aurantimonas sp. VKM B-3413 TaxID=2779401 RepID=UPI001E35E225|nr:sulfite exporter TauE/SafE family protein [Aurantimonas sp. VKM B-3413]MCB8837097.1 sulfite exporter TauE/SafE family protein [Aurantimonas sp. VKM B-3413]